MVVFLALGILLLFYMSLNRVRMIFARLSILCNSFALSAKLHCVPLEPWNP